VIDDIAFALTAAVVMFGVLGTIIPLLPGLMLVWAAALGWGLVMGFGSGGIVAMALITGLLVAGIYLSIRIPQRSAAAQGLSLWGTLFGLLLAIALGIVLPIVGIPIGFVLGVWVVRVIDTGDASEAFRSALQTTLALLRASAAQFGVATAMGLTWLVWALNG
jgi:hypothetical protein